MAAYSQQEMDSNYMIKVMIKVYVVFLIIWHPVLSAEMLQNVALRKPVTLSTILNGYTQSKPSSAVDGRIHQEIDKCWCCVSTLNESNPWLTVDLGEEYLAQKIVVIGRSDYSNNQISRNLTNLQIFNGNHTSRGQLVEQMQIKMVNNTATARNLEQFLRHITLKRPKPAYVTSAEWFLTVCEIEIYVKECPSGQYGNGVCNKTCGHCKDGSPCDGVTGQCSEGCNPGYVGNTCTQECTSGTYGNCNQKCGQCKGGNCDKVTGRCPTGCNLGYMGERCDQECTSGTYANCSQKCGQCKGGNCDKVTGRCPAGCNLGYMGERCDQDCAVGYYGNCSHLCGNCIEGQSCDQVDGSCPRGCSPGYKGYTCHEGYPKNEAADEKSSPIATVAVSVSVCAVAAAVAVIVAVRVMRRKRMLMSRKESTYEVPVWHAHQDESAYSVLDNTHNLCSSDSTNK